MFTPDDFEPFDRAILVGAGLETSPYPYLHGLALSHAIVLDRLRALGYLEAGQITEAQFQPALQRALATVVPL